MPRGTSANHPDEIGCSRPPSDSIASPATTYSIWSTFGFAGALSDSRSTIICVVSSPEQPTGTSLIGSRPLRDRSARSAIDRTRDSPAFAAGTGDVGSGVLAGSGVGGGGGGGGAADSGNSIGALAAPGR